MEIKPKLIALIERGCEQEQALFASLSEDERAVKGKPDRWSPKDVIAHLAAWKTRMADNLAAAARGEAPVRYDDFEETNARDFEAYRDEPWPKILEKATTACRQLVEQVEQRSEAELRSAELLPSQEDRPLWRSIAGNSYMHPLMHLSQIYAERGGVEFATEMQKEAARLLAELDESQTWQGVVRYNLACHYALVGERQEAIAGLQEALELNPGLTEWSKEDPDFASIRREPGYAALYTE